MKKTSEILFDGAGNPTARAILSVDEAILDLDFVTAYEKRLFGYFGDEFSSIADNLAMKNYPTRKKRARPVTIAVTLRRIKLKKTYVIESVSCDKGAKNLYKSRVIHVFGKVGDSLAYLGTRKKAIAEKLAAASNI